MQRATRLFFLFVLPATLLAGKCMGQAVPDTTLNTVFPDSTAPTKLAGPHVDPDSTNMGQEAALRNLKKDTLVKKEPFQPNPKKSGLYSAILPGLGQLYNRQYWKVPVIYVGVGVAAYFFTDNLKNYQNYRKAYIGRLNNPFPNDPYPNYTEANLQQLQSDYERYLDLTALIGVLGYALQVVDAIAAAHLKNFDVSGDISMRVQPVAMPMGAGLGLVVNFK